MTKIRLHGIADRVLKTCLGHTGHSGQRSRRQGSTLSTCKMVLFFHFTIFICWPLSSQARGLDIAEQELAEALSNQVVWSTNSDRKIKAHPLGVQTLFIERRESKQAAVQERMASVYQYDYLSQTARLLIVDLQDQRVMRTSTIDSVHLPLNQTEIDFARDLLAAESSIMNQLRTEQSDRGAHPFDSLAELDVKASIFEPQDQEHPCATERCALLSLFDASSTVFSTEPIAYLDRQSIGLLQGP